MDYLDELRAKSVFKDMEKLSFDYVPKELPHRGEDLKKLARIFKTILTTDMTRNVLITGKVGSGKTVISKHFCKNFQKYAIENNKKIDYVFVNCRKRTTESMVMLKIMNHFQKSFPDRGFSTGEMFDILSKNIEKKNTHLIIVMDEVDVLLKKSGPDLIYTFSRFSEEEEYKKLPISLILISQKSIIDLLDSSTISTFGRSNTIELDKYNKNQLFDIIKLRTELAFHHNVVDEEIIELISDISSEWGDARFAIEVLLKSGMLADEEANEIISAENVRAAKAGIYSVVTEEKLRDLDKQKKLVLIAISRILKKKTFAMTGEVENAYFIACEEFNEKKRGHTQLWSYLKDLDNLGIIEAKKGAKGILGTTTLVSLPDIPASVLEEKVVSLLKKLI